MVVLVVTDSAPGVKGNNLRTIVANAGRVFALPRITRGAWIATGAALAVVPLLPSTLPLARGVDFGPVLQSWAIGLLVVSVLGLIAGRLAWRAKAQLRWPCPRPVVAVPLLALALCAAGVWVMLDLFNGNPQLVDEIAQLLQAQAFAAGRLAAPAPVPPDAFLVTHTWVTDGKWFSQFPPGYTAMLALGLLFHAEWLVNPLLGGASVALVFYVARGIYGPKTALTAVVLWAVSPWVVAMSGTYMNHAGATTLALGAWALLWGPRRPRPWHALAAGLALAGVAAMRPLDAVAAALPMLVWIARRRRWSAIPLLALGGAPVMLTWAWFNWRLFGNPLTVGYSLLWGPEHGLGFHHNPWGEQFTPRVAVDNMVVALRRLNVYLYEWPIPALVPLVVWALAARQRSWRDLLLVVGLTAAPVLYFFYWHSGNYPGPRFYYAAAPFLVITTARAWRWAWRLARRAPGRHVSGDVALAGAASAAFVWSWIALVPERMDIYRAQFATLKLRPERELAARGVRQALVLVPESFGSRTQVGLWGLGLRPGQAERAYRRLDTCDLFLFSRHAGEARWPPPETAARLDSLMAHADSAPPRLESWPDPSIKLRPGSTPPEACQVELRRDLAGFTLYGYLPWRNKVGLDSGIVFARDLFERNPQLLGRYPGWEVWRLAPPLGRPDTLPLLTRLSP
ncbi:MAG: hypothetical protein HY560_01780 [Gemmatimonadetes bacterium]|nr:hypothetical protein [Gemmatimonadota bacterium]